LRKNERFVEKAALALFRNLEEGNSEIPQFPIQEYNWIPPEYKSPALLLAAVVRYSYEKKIFRL
jgi:hypothetical protein